jgi:hypothetical protein
MNNAQLSHAQDEYEAGIEYDVDYSLVAWLSGEPNFESEAPGMFFDGLDGADMEALRSLTIEAVEYHDGLGNTAAFQAKSAEIISLFLTGMRRLYDR